MADITITPADVEQSEDAVILHGRAAEAITAGQALYRLSDGTYGLADADHATAARRRVAGIALHTAAQGQPVAVQTSGRIFIGGDAVQSEIYVLSDNAGGICPASDLASGDEVALIGIGYTGSGSPLVATELILNIWPTGIAVPA